MNQEHVFKNLHRKGWSKTELDHASSVLKHHKGEHHFFTNLVDGLLRWLLFIEVIIANGAAVTLLIPIMHIFPNVGVYAFSILIGVMFGFLYEVAIRHVENKFLVHHYIVAGILIPIIAGITAGYIAFFADNSFGNVFSVERYPIAIGVCYGVAFAIPYIIVKGIEWSSRNK